MEEDAKVSGYRWVTRIALFAAAAVVLRIDGPEGFLVAGCMLMLIGISLKLQGAHSRKD
jgi:hypothetical protein